MIKGLKKLQAALFAVAVLLMFALVFTFVYGAGSGNEILPVAEASAETYEHGTLTTQTGAADIQADTYSQLIDAIKNNQSVSLSADIEIPSSDFLSASRYEKVIYGNGHSIILNVPTTTGSHDNHSLQDTGYNSNYVGGLIGELVNGGAIYDCKFILQGGSFKTGQDVSGNSVRFGGIIGSIWNGRVENVSVVVSSGVSAMIYCWGTGDIVTIGMLAGYVGSSSTIRNVTIENNGGTFIGGYAGDTGDVNSVLPGRASWTSTANLAGSFDASAHTIDNIIVKGSGATLTASYVSNLGTAEGGGTSISMTNFYNAFQGTLTAITRGSLTFVNHGTANASLSIGTYYEYYNGESDKIASNGLETPHNQNSGGRRITSNKISIGISFVANATGDLGVSFDPTVAADQSLVIVCSGMEKPSAEKERGWTITAYNNNYSKNGVTISGDSTDTIVFADMPTSASVWSDDTWASQNADLNDGRFIATLTYSDTITFDGLPQLTQYEHGYVADSDKTTTGTEISSAEEFSDAFSPGATQPRDGVYYLTQDIYVNAFSGREEFSGTLDGNGHTIYITGLYQNSFNLANVGGIIGTLNGGTIKNLRVVLMCNVTVTSASTDNRSIGLIAGQLSGGAVVENVNIVLMDGYTLSTASGASTALGGVAGSVSGSATISNVTVQLNGDLDVNGTECFVSGFVGKTNDSATTNYSNIIIKGDGKMTGAIGSNPWKNTAAVTVITGSVGSAGSPRVTADGIIYGITENTYGTSMADSQTASFGLFGYTAPSGTTVPNPITDTAGYVAVSNFFLTSDSAYNPYDNNAEEGNLPTYIAVTPTATITSTVEGAIGSRVTPYFVPGSTTDITLVAVAGDWNGITRLQTNGSDKGDLRPASNGTIVVTAAKSEAYADGTITLSKYVAATLTVTYTSVKYSGSEANFGISVSIGGNILDPSNYTILYEGDEDTTYAQSATAPANVGNYIITVTLTNGDMFEGNGGNLTSSKQSFVTITRADLPNTVTVSIEGWTYGHYDADTNAPSVSFPEGFGAADVTYVYYSSNSDDAVISGFDPETADAGTYYVAAQIEQTANYNGGTTARVPFTINKADLATDSITVTMGGWTYGDAPKSPSISGIDNFPGLTPSSYNYKGMSANGTKYDSADKPTNAGTYTVTVTFGESTNYVGGSVTSAEFTISPKELTFTATLEVDAKITYGDVLNAEALKNLVKIECSDTPAYDDDYTVTVEATGYSEDTPADTVIALTVTVSFDESIKANYSFTQPDASALILKVQKKELTLSVNEGEKTNVYGAVTDYDAHFAGLFSLDGVVGSDDFASLFDVNIEGQGGASLPNAGTYTVTAALNDTEAARNYTLKESSVNSYTYTITPFIVTGSIEPSAEYSGSAFTPEWTVTEALPNNETQEDMEVSVAYALNSGSGVTTIQNVGQYTVTVTLGNTNYAFAAGEGTSQEQDYSFEVTKAENIFTTEFDANWTYGEEPTIEPPVAKFGDVSVTYFSDDSYNNVVESFSSTTAAGTYYYVITVEESANWTNESMELYGSFVIEKAQTTVTLSVEEGAVFDGAAYDGKITVELGNSAVSLGDVTWQYKVGDGGWTEGLPVNAGTYTISIKTYSNSGNVTVTNLGDATAQLVISPKDITFNAELAENASLTYGDTLEQDQMNALVNVGVAEGQESIGFTFTVSLMAGDVAFGSTTAANAIVTVFVELTATDSNYNAVNPAALELTVQRRVITGALRATSATYDGAVQTVEFVPDNVANGDDVTFAYSYTLNNNYAESILGAGTYAVKVTLADDNEVNDNYILDVDELTFTVEKLTINATLSATVNNSSIAEFADNALVIHGSNVDDVTFSLNGGQLSVYRGLALAATISATFAAADGTPYTPDGITFAIRGLALENGIAAGTGIAATSVTVAFEDGDFSLGSITSITFEVGGSISVAGEITTTANYGDGTYTPDSFTNYFVIEGEGAATITIYEGTSASGQPLDSISDAGTYYVQGAIDGGVSTGFTFTIMPKQVTVEVTNANDLTYTGSELELTLESDADDMLSADGVTLGYEVQDGGSILNAGDYTITFTLAGDKSANYAFSSAGTTVRVEKAQIEIDFEVSDVTYSGEEVQDPVPNGNLGSGDVTVTFEAVVGSLGENNRPVGVGEYRVTVIVAETENYFGDTLEKTFSVTPKSVAVNITNANDLVYDGTVHALTLESEGTIAGDDVTLGYQLGDGTQNIIAADTYTVTFTLAGDDSGNYALVSETASVTVRKAELTVTVENEEALIYNNAVHELALMLDGVCGDDRVSVDYALEDGTQNIIAADTYTVTFTLTGDDSGNYALVSETATVTVQKREVSVTLTQTEFTYSGSEIVLDYDVDDDVFAGDSVLAEYGSDFDMLNAGKYEVTFTLTGDAADNYNLTNPSHTVTVNPANVTASISAPSATYDGAVYDGSMTVTLDTVGLSLGEITWQYRVGDGGWTEGLPVNAGTYTISIKAYSNSGNVTVTNLGDATAQLVIDKAQVRYTATLAEGAEIVFGDTFTQEQMNALVTVTDGAGVPVNSYNVSLTLEDGTSYNSSVPAGTTVYIVIESTADAANYEVTVEGGLTLAVQSKAIDIVLDTDGNGETDEDKISSGATVTIQQGESLALAAAVEAFLEEQGIPAGSYRILIDGAEFAGTENLAARTYRMQVSLTGGYQGVLEFMLTVEGDDEPVAPPVDPDEPDDPDPDEPVDPDPEEPVDPDEPGTPDEPEQPAQPDGEGFPGWAIAVIVCGGLLVIAAVTGIAVAAARKRKKSGDKK